MDQRLGRGKAITRKEEEEEVEVVGWVSINGSFVLAMGLGCGL